MAEAVVCLFVDEAEAGGLVDAPRRVQHAVGPERDLAIAHLPAEADAFVHQPRADAQPARFRIDEQQAQLGDRIRIANEEDGADVFPVLFGDPATLPLRIEAPEELGSDLGDERFELLVPEAGSDAQAERVALVGLVLLFFATDFSSGRRI